MWAKINNIAHIYAQVSFFNSTESVFHFSWLATALFQKNKCDTCHVGKNLGGQSYDLMGLAGNYFADRPRELTADDHGRFNVTKDPRDMHRFKTPGLRNIALTAPYFHDAQAEDLTQAVEMMLKYQVGTNLPPQDVLDIVAFLESLTGEYTPYKE